ncbi:MAG: hypothetical protein WC798_01270 [Candidatus Paceibacterota bacterium]|jgi:hypothetical protein
MRFATAVLLMFFMLAPVVLAAPQTSVRDQSSQTQTSVRNTSGSRGTVVTLVNPLGEGVGLFGLLDKILQLVVRIGTIAIILILVYIGYLFVAARGVPGKIEEARRALLWTVVGALILLGAQAIALGISATVQAIATGN